MTRVEAIDWIFQTHMALDSEMTNVEDEENARELAEVFNALNVTIDEFVQIGSEPYRNVHALVLVELK